MSSQKEDPGGRSDGLPRRAGQFLLTSVVGSDALGTVFRALSPAGAGDFVRLRLFDAPELPRGEVAAALLARSAGSRPGPGPEIARDERPGIADGVAFLAWAESHAQGLDRLLAAARLGPGLSTAHAFLVADRVARALEHAGRSSPSAVPHGLVWPGFVTVGPDGDVRLGGFGVASAILPWLSAPRLAREIAPYVAPECRGGREPGAPHPKADVYALGALLFELLTERRPPLHAPAEALSGPDRLPRFAAEVLRGALAPPHIRTPTPSAFRVGIGSAIVASGVSPSSHDLGAIVRELIGSARSVREEAPVPVVVSAEEEDEWEQALSRLEPAGDSTTRPIPRSGLKARVPIPAPEFRSRDRRRPPGQ